MSAAGASARQRESKPTMSVEAPITAWSYSRLSLYELCPRKFKYKNVDKLPEPKSDAMQRGIDIHKECEDYLTARTDALPATPRAMDRFGALFADLRAANPQVEQEWAFRADWKATGWFAKDCWYRATLDVGLLYPDNTFLVIDHKSGKPYGTNEDQMEQFAVAVFARYPQVKEVDTRLWYLDIGDEQKMEFLRKDFVALRDKWVARANVMFGERTFPAHPGTHCRFCHYRRSNDGPCQFG